MYKYRCILLLINRTINYKVNHSVLLIYVEHFRFSKDICFITKYLFSDL